MTPIVVKLSEMSQMVREAHAFRQIIELVRGNGRRKVEIAGDEHGFIVDRTHFLIDQADEGSCGMGFDADPVAAVAAAFREGE